MFPKRNSQLCGSLEILGLRFFSPCYSLKYFRSPKSWSIDSTSMPGLIFVTANCNTTKPRGNKIVNIHLTVKNVKLCSTICQNFFHKNCVSRARKKKTENFVKGKYNLQFKYRIREWRSQAPASCCSCRYILWLTQRVFLNGTSSRDRI